MLPGLPGGALVIPRNRVLFTRLAMGAIPRKQRKDAVALELEQQAPFEEPSAWVVWQGTTACVWYWPGQGNATQAQPMPEVPETALWPILPAGQGRWVEDSEQGLYLLQFNHPRTGWFEKRFTRPVQGQEAGAWLQRHGAAPEVAANIRPTAPPALSEPVGESLNAAPSSLEARVLPGALALLLLVAVMYTVAIGRAGWEAGQAEEAANAMRSDVQNIIELRNRATALQNELQSLGALSQPSQVRLAAGLAEALNLENAELIRWNYRNGRLEVTWQNQSTPPDATTIIRELESRPEFNNVQAQLLADNAVEIILNVEEAAL